MASLEKEKAALEEALAAARAEAKKNSEAAEAARQDARAAEEAKINAEKAKVEADEARKLAEAACARGKENIQRWHRAICTSSDLVQADLHGLLEKFGLELLRYHKMRTSKCPSSSAGFALVWRWLILGRNSNAS